MTKDKKITHKTILLVLIISVLSSLSLVNYAILNNHRNNSKNIRYNPIKKPSLAINLNWEETILNAGEDSGNAIVMGENSSVYIAGKLYNQTKGYSVVFLAKYNSSGAQTWNKTFSSSNFESIAYGIDYDFKNHYLYITGYTKNSSLNANLFLAKYDKNGNYCWNTSWGGDALDAFDCGYAVKVNASNPNEIYVAGLTETLGQLGDVVLLKYNSSGDLQWVKNWGYDDTDSAKDLVLSNDGILYIAGFTDIEEKTQLLLLNYNITLNDFEWNKTWGSNAISQGESITIDSSNNLYLGGFTDSFSQGSYNFVVIKYNKIGERIWNYTWGGTNDDKAYGICLDSKNNSYLVGYSDENICLVKFNSTGGLLWYKVSSNEGNGYGICISLNKTEEIYVIGKNNNEIFLSKYSQLPDTFILNSNKPDGISSNGNFTISWTKSLDAHNYSLYQWDRPFTKYDGSQTVICEGLTNYSYALTNYAMGEYYFLAVIFNEYGNTSSNCLKIIVLYPPSSFNLKENNENPDTDGTVNLSWSVSERFENYSIYSHTSFIRKIENNGTLVKEGLLNHSYLITGLLNQIVYYIIVAKNRAGENQSNCVEIVVRRKPTNFMLTATTPNGLGQFEVIWTYSNFTTNYTIYLSNNFFISINAAQKIGVFVPEFEWPTYRITQQKGAGTYYYVVVAANKYGNSTSNCVSVKIPIIPESDSKEKDDHEKKNEFIVTELTVIIAAIGSIGGAIALIGAFYWFKTRTPKTPIKIKRAKISDLKKEQLKSRPKKPTAKKIKSRKARELEEKRKEKK